MHNFQYRWRLWRLQKERSAILRAGEKRYAEAKKSGASHEELERVHFDERVDLELVDDEIQLLESRYLREEARRLLLPEPQFSTDDIGSFWEQSKVSGRYLLGPEGVSHLRALIRKEKRERREAVVFWLAAITGIIGALTGLAAILLK